MTSAAQLEARFSLVIHLKCYKKLVLTIQPEALSQHQGTTQILDIVRSAKLCCHFFGLLFSAYFWRESSVQIGHETSPFQILGLPGKCTQRHILGLRPLGAEYIKFKVQWRHLFADLTIYHSGTISRQLTAHFHLPAVYCTWQLILSRTPLTTTI